MLCCHQHLQLHFVFFTTSVWLWKFGERMYSVLNHLEPTWTSLNLSWNNACACEQSGNHFKFVGTDLWTIEPIGTYRNQVGTNLEPNGTSLCMEELGDGFSFVFVVFGCCLDPCLRNLMLWTYLVGVLWVICEFELKTFYLEKLEERFWSLRTLLK